MKRSQVGAIIALSYLCGTIALFWRPNFKLLGRSLLTVTAVCGASAIGGPAAWPACMIASGAALLINIMGSIHAGQPRGNNNSPVKRDGYNWPVVWHDLGNGTVLNYIDAKLFQHGIKHSIWDESGNKFTGTRHASGKAQLTVHIPHDPLTKRNEDVSEIDGVWDETVTTANDDFGQDDANAISNGMSQAFSTGQGDHLCVTLTPENGDAESVNIGVTPMGNGGPSTPYDACGA
ncbi:hypothetical protein VTL71DRAFT_16500 [Oculimacula yallundae]|uniref:Uncharacterized protein n=1 Tax=Oculimacula yallundae TaxID=86028 RepID=A0ABR4CFV4_9HELO